MSTDSTPTPAGSGAEDAAQFGDRNYMVEGDPTETCVLELAVRLTSADEIINLNVIVGSIFFATYSVSLIYPYSNTYFVLRGINHTIYIMQKSNERVSEIPFDSATKYMATLHFLDRNTYEILKLAGVGGREVNSESSARNEGTHHSTNLCVYFYTYSQTAMYACIYNIYACIYNICK